jgi:hypothetical protein
MKIFILSCLSLFSLNAIAQFDLKVGAEGRSYPAVGGGFLAESGYNFKFWDKTTGEKKDMWKFGLIRPHVGVRSSFVVNQALVGVDFYPLSIVSIGGGFKWERSDFKFGFFDCDKVICKNSYEKPFWRVQLAFAYKTFVMLAKFRQDDIWSKKSGARFGEFRYILHGDSSGDTLDHWQIFFGKQMEDKKMLGLLYERVSLDQTNNKSTNVYAIYQFPWGEKKTSLGFGPFESTQQGRGLNLVFRIEHDILDQVKLL